MLDAPGLVEEDYRRAKSGKSFEQWQKLAALVLLVVQKSFGQLARHFIRIQPDEKFDKQSAELLFGRRKRCSPDPALQRLSGLAKPDDFQNGRSVSELLCNLMR